MSYRHKAQIATIGPVTKTQVEVGLNMKGVAVTDRLEEVSAGRMCNHRIRLSDPEEVDAELMSWLRAAYEAAG